MPIHLSVRAHSRNSLLLHEGNIFWHLATQGETSVHTARSLAEERAAERCRDLRGLIRLLASMARCWPEEDGGSKGGEPNSTKTTGADGSAVRWSCMLLCYDTPHCQAR